MSTESLVPKVLIVDDDLSVRHVLSLGLEMEGFDVAAAEDGFAGLRAAMKERPDLLVLDMMLPGRDGIAVLEWFRSHDDLADIPVLMLTARSGVQDLQRASRAGVDRYMTKPFAFDHLVWQLREMLVESSRCAIGAACSTPTVPSSPLAVAPR